MSIVAAEVPRPELQNNGGVGGPGMYNRGPTLWRPYWWVDLMAKTHDLCQSQCPFFIPQKAYLFFIKIDLRF